MFRLIEHANWVAIAILLTASACGLRDPLPWLVALAAFQLALGAYRASWALSLPVQVRVSHLIMVVVGSWPPLALVHWIQCVSIWTMLLTEYCFLARGLSLAPWNRSRPLTRATVRRAFVSAPQDVGVLQG